MWLPGIGLGVLGAAWMVSLAQLTPEGLAPGEERVIKELKLSEADAAKTEEKPTEEKSGGH